MLRNQTIYERFAREATKKPSILSTLLISRDCSGPLLWRGRSENRRLVDRDKRLFQEESDPAPTPPARPMET